MIKRLKEKFRKEPKTWFTSDLHFNHSKIISYCNRPFKTREEMNEHIIKVWNKTVKKQDTVWILGDFSLNPNAAFKIAPRLNGIKNLVAGNHDSCFIGHKKFKKFQGKYEENGFNRVFSDLTVTRLKGSIYVILSHLPYKPNSDQNYDSRYLEYRPFKMPGYMLLHGHLHGRYIKDGNQIDVSWDAHNGKILSEDDVIDLINDKRNFIKSHLTDFYNNRVKGTNNIAD